MKKRENIKIKKDHSLSGCETRQYDMPHDNMKRNTKKNTIKQK